MNSMKNIKKVWRFLVSEGLAKARRDRNEWMYDMILGMKQDKLTNAQVELLNDFLEYKSGTMLDVSDKEAKL